MQPSAVTVPNGGADVYVKRGAVVGFDVGAVAALRPTLAVIQAGLAEGSIDALAAVMLVPLTGGVAAVVGGFVGLGVYEIGKDMRVNRCAGGAR